MLYNIISNQVLASFIFSILVTFFTVKFLISYLTKREEYQPIRAEGPQSHIKTKGKTPTMGGIAMYLAIFLSTLLFTDISKPHMIILLVLMTVFAIIGLLDDVIKVFFKNTKGFRGSKKLITQLLTTSALMLALVYFDSNYLDYGINIPVINYNLNFGLFMPILYVFFICGSANAANITDGLDGLLSIPVIFVTLTLQIICISFFKGSALPIDIDPTLVYDIIIVLVSIVGSFFTFLFFNKHPAKIFMGDVGALMIGAVLCYLSILLKLEFLYGIMALLFIGEIMSSIIQVGYFKLTHGKRLFKMAPFHHHLEQCGYKETTVMLILWTFALICCIIAYFLFSITAY